MIDDTQEAAPSTYKADGLLWIWKWFQVQKVRKDVVDSVIVDANIYNPGGTHLGAFPGTLLIANHQDCIFIDLSSRMCSCHSRGIGNYFLSAINHLILSWLQRRPTGL